MIGVALAVAGTAMSVYGSFKASKEQEAVAKYNAKIARADGIANQKAILLESEIKLDQDRKKFSIGRVQRGNRGLTSEGSPMLVQADAFADIVADQSELQRQSQIARIRGDAGASQLNRQASAEASARGINAFGQSLSGASSLITTYQNNQARNAQMDMMQNTQNNQATTAGTT